MEKVKFGIIGCGLMGREFASAAARWCHLEGDIPAPEIIGISDTNAASFGWFDKHFPGIKKKSSDCNELLNMKEIEAIYCAVPHNLHEKLYIDIINSGKHLLGEKPFGIDKTANENILAAVKKNPKVFVRCSSEFPFYPAAQRLWDWIEKKEFGRILEVKAGFCHSSDMDLNKPVNWKRQSKYNGEYGCLGDLGIHAEHIPFRAGWVPKNVHARLSKFVEKRPDGSGKMAECDVWDNASLSCEVKTEQGPFPMFIETKRMDPGATNMWYLQVKGMNGSAYFTTDDSNAFHYLKTDGKEQPWSRIVVGCKPQFPVITGNIFEFGFTDAILQMWAAFICEAAGKKIKFGCFRPEETKISHSLHTAALESQKTNMTVEVK
ncbi:MAG: oxidoreductase [Candidatus Firestonebacteria bacterium RIFOXYC2_FULL_39_67]|nr:MAG: oxidoreductase [Candidatus Firestonebacteria bacterium RIFOXYD2_FULL_39_29]OGF54532.1 MAG: oxidoreductase [Candidatus Firestonebacteria bacterium RIFOXYC2_FULL_39_67]OGF54597.1 MAG: oxidoreductase [Candidatus Firestonebacteria bacterium RifOxyC12_full_39_7]